MDAYGEFMRQLANARLEELRREAAAYRLARSLETTSTRRGWFNLLARLRAGRAVAKPAPVSDPTTAEQELRRAA